MAKGDITKAGSPGSAEYDVPGDVPTTDTVGPQASGTPRNKDWWKPFVYPPSLQSADGVDSRKSRC